MDDPKQRLRALELKKDHPANIYFLDEVLIFLNLLSKNIGKFRQTSDATFAYGVVLPEFLWQKGHPIYQQSEILIYQLNLTHINLYILMNLLILDRSDTFHQD